MFGLFCVYNITFNNCYSYNVSRFIVNYSSDTSIIRIGQSAEYNNCSCYFSSGSTPVDHSVIISSQRYESGGTALPSYTEWDFKTQFNNCEFSGGSSVYAVRFIGNLGKTTFNNCVFRDSTRGIYSSFSTGIWDLTAYGNLAVRDCLFKNNDYDLWMVNDKFAVIDNCSFREGTGVGYPVRLEGADYTRFSNCSFFDLAVDKAYARIYSSSTGTIFDHCYFDSIPTSGAVFTDVPLTYAYDCLFLGTPSSNEPLIGDENTPLTLTLQGSTSGSHTISGTYNRKGNQVTFEAYGFFVNSMVGNITVTGLPFASDGISNVQFINEGRLLFVRGDATGFYGEIANTSATITLKETNSSGTTRATAVTDANWSPGVSTYIRIKGTYICV